ncbi:hypothetical protein UFOVP606_18 [uncultured Caudovirales phage]|uniref:Uncharacterized protein n=1 Tax=uncultured Caudovirales phage TaxID=2100421 RepID=A0A6J5N1Q4_9CAUD|nr:hypothetical protein UFOVP606_18 [uncultured Caudovirales phage]
MIYVSIEIIPKFVEVSIEIINNIVEVTAELLPRINAFGGIINVYIDGILNQSINTVNFATETVNITI